MKILLLIIPLIFIGPAHAAENQHSHDTHEHTASAKGLSAGNIDPEGTTINVNVFGLVCDFCAQAIEKVFMKKNEVSGVNVDLAGGLVAIYTKKGKNIDDDEVKKLIVDAGYNVDSINRK